MTRPVCKALFLLGATFAMSIQGAAAQDWSGPYGGAVFGYVDGTSNHIDRAAETGAPDISGEAIGATLGHNFTAGALVYGVEFDVAELGVTGQTGPGLVGTFGCGNGCRTEITWLATLRARAGFAQGRTLFFGTAGLAMGGVEGSLPGESYADEGPRTANGWTVGAGVEHMVGDRISVKGEVLHTDLGATRYDDRSFEPGFTVETEFTQVRLGQNFSF